MLAPYARTPYAGTPYGSGRRCGEDVVDVLDRARIAERIEAATVESLVGMMSAEMAESLGVAVTRLGGGLGVRMAASPGFAFLNRVFAVGLDDPLSAEVLDEAVGFLGAGGGTTLLVQHPPVLETPELLELLASRGFTRGGTWAKMLRPVGDPPEAPTDLRIAEVDPAEADRFGAVQAEGMEMPPFMAPWCARQVTAAGWHTYAAYDGDEMVAIGSLFTRGDAGQLSGAATLPSHRGRGAQLALMARRIADARDLGVRWIGAETGSETPEDPNPSLHNMRRAGMTELYARQNWLLRR